MSTRAYQPNDSYLLSNIAVCRKALALVNSPAEVAALGCACARNGIGSGPPLATWPTCCTSMADSICLIMCWAC
jgi:hypothetical protein